MAALPHLILASITQQPGIFPPPPLPNGMLVRVPPGLPLVNNVSLVPVHTPGCRGTMWHTVSCLVKQQGNSETRSQTSDS